MLHNTINFKLQQQRSFTLILLAGHAERCRKSVDVVFFYRRPVYSQVCMHNVLVFSVAFCNKIAEALNCSTVRWYYLYMPHRNCISDTTSWNNTNDHHRTFPDIFNIFDFEVKKITDKSDKTEGKTSDNDGDDDNDDDDDGPSIELIPKDGEDTGAEGKNPGADTKTVCRHSFLVVLVLGSRLVLSGHLFIIVRGVWFLNDTIHDTRSKVGSEPLHQMWLLLLWGQMITPRC